MLPHEPIDRATEAWNRLVADHRARSLWRRDGVIRETRQRRQVPLWPYTQVMQARSLVAFLSDLPDHSEGKGFSGNDAPAPPRRTPVADLPPMLMRYSSGAAFTDRPHGAHRYVDDNAWVALAQWQHRRLLTPEAEPSQGAVTVLGWLADQVDDQGGAPWREGGLSRHACSTGAVGVALGLGPGEGSRAHVIAARNSAFLHDVLVDDDGLVRDNIDARGMIEPTYWTYNQGLLVRLDTALHVLGDDRALSRADESIAAGAATFTSDALWRQPIAFNAIWFRALMARAVIEPHPSGTDAAVADFHDYVERLVEHLNEQGGRVGPPGTIGRYESGQSGVLDQAGAVQILALAAFPVDQRWRIV